MSGISHRLNIGLKALRELGLPQLSLYAFYQLGLRSGHYRRLTPTPSAPQCAQPLRPILHLPEVDQQTVLLGEKGLTALTDEAKEIVAGQVRLFGGLPVPLDLTPQLPLRHWTEYETFGHDLGDLKLIWEPARFGWVFTLGRAYLLTQDESFPQAFWGYLEAFQKTNPPYLGPNWISGQETALRLIGFIFAAQVFSSSRHSTPVRQAQLAEGVAQHAARIPPTLIYARAQNNNHLISEALGLYSAAAALPDHPSAPAWQKLGWQWLNHAFQNQIAPDGTYSQHSTNYHRLMLQAALWALAIQPATSSEKPFPPQTLARLQAAVSWLLALVDPRSGGVPNLGPNDGAYIFPLTSLPFEDFRPVLQAAARAFHGRSAFSPGSWDEISLWFGLPLVTTSNQEPAAAGLTHPNQTVLHGAYDSWAYLRAVHFTSRPGHSDQLHLDLWWQGMNVTLDPGTYRYTAPLPWDNALCSPMVHNTITLDGQEPMTRAGRFLYLDWAQAQVTRRTKDAIGDLSLIGQHNGYHRFGITHQRQVTAAQDGTWLVEDTLTGPAVSNHDIRLHWLIPDWHWEANLSSTVWDLRFASPQGLVKLSIHAAAERSGQVMPAAMQCSMVRAGVLILGPGPSHPTWGWTSPTYNDKIPALAVIVDVNSQLPLHITSHWNFMDEKS